jgi:hypothetical protein
VCAQAFIQQSPALRACSVPLVEWGSRKRLSVCHVEHQEQRTFIVQLPVYFELNWISRNYV